MKLSPCLKFLAASAVALIGLNANAEVLDFEDLSGTNSGPALTNYHGVSFDSNYFTYDGPQWPYTTSSGVVRIAFNAQGTGPGESFFSFDIGDVIFNGAYFAGYAVYGGVPGDVYFNLYKDSVLVGVSSVLIPSDTPTWLSSGYAGLVDQVGVVANRGYVVMDDVTYNAGSSVPDTGATLGLLGFTVLALGAIRRRIRA